MKKYLPTLATLAMVASLTGSAHAVVIIHVWEDGNDVRLRASGTLDITGMNFFGNTDFINDVIIEASDPEILFFPDGNGGVIYQGLLSSPVFGTGARFTSSFSSGDTFGFEQNSLLVPDRFLSGGSIFSEGVFTNADLSTLGANPGSYDYTLPNDTINLIIGRPPTIPEPSAMIFGLSGLGLLFRRRRTT